MKAEEMPHRGNQECRKENEMSKMSVAVLMVAALVVVSVLAAAVVFRASIDQASAAPAPAANVAPLAPAVASLSAQPVAARSVFISEKKIQRFIDHIANDHRWNGEGKAWVRLLNKRHEHRCCGLPR